MNHYCTYFDRGFLIQGLAMWRSLAGQDRDSVLWVLALDEFTAEVLREGGGTWLRLVRLEEVEAGDEELKAAKENRTKAEYYFTLSPCWPRWLLKKRPEIERVTYLDADLFFFGDPGVIFDAMDEAGASVLVTRHRFPSWLKHYEKHGVFNVGVLSFRRDEVGLRCLDEWRKECLAWCYDRLEEGRYADQKYLDAWPETLGGALLVLEDAEVNAAPWNWVGVKWEVGEERRGGGSAPPAEVHVEGKPLVVFHFARFRPICGTWWWQSGQLDYGVMPWRLRNALYGAYWRALDAARQEIAARRPGFGFPDRAARFDRSFWRGLPLRVVFGSDWLRVGNKFVSGRWGLGRWSGRVLGVLRRMGR